MLRLLGLAVLVAALAGSAADAATLRWANRGDSQTTDPHSQNEGLTNNINQLLYEFLVGRDKRLNLVPELAVSWQQIDPLTWRFKLRPGVKFHDGTPFTADDVVFSYERARAEASQLRVYANAAGIPRKIDDLTVEFTTSGPNPVELEHIATINIMSKAWCEKNGATKPQNFAQKEDLITAHQANGTGPYMLKSREPDVKTVLVKNPNWWGIKEGRFEGNVDTVIFTPIASDATRLAALLSGEIDLINDPPPQDVPRLKQNPQIHVLEGVENRVVFIGMDQQRDELLYSSVKGRNPFKDKRVRQALYEAIDIDAMRSTTMRGLVATDRRDAAGAAAVDRRAGAAAALRSGEGAHAARRGRLPNGFEVTLDCPNNRYVNDEKICQALAAMWSQIGVTTSVTAMPRSHLLPKDREARHQPVHARLGRRRDRSDLHPAAGAARCQRPAATATTTTGATATPRLDALIDQIKIELDVEKRRRLINEALMIQHDELLHLPLHRQVIPWATRANVRAVHLANNNVIPQWVTVH